jgi:hypothetical protein
MPCNAYAAWRNKRLALPPSTALSVQRAASPVTTLRSPRSLACIACSLRTISTKEAMWGGAVARIGPFHIEHPHPRLQQDVTDVLERDILVVRAFAIPPADVVTDLPRRYAICSTSDAWSLR